MEMSKYKQLWVSGGTSDVDQLKKTDTTKVWHKNTGIPLKGPGQVRNKKDVSKVMNHIRDELNRSASLESEKSDL